MRDYSEQNWREPDAETVRDNETAALFVALFVGLTLGATICGWLWS